MTADNELQREGADCLAAALAMRADLHRPGQRDRYRALLQRATDCCQRALDAAAPDAAFLRAAAHSTLAAAHAAIAEDALHGAGQLSLSSQRAPTRAACDAGWERVATIVAGAESSARAAAVAAHELGTARAATKVARAAREAAERAGAAAAAARRLVEGRNHAYTFHADDRFSFGEGWYLAAAAVLDRVPIQIEPGRDGTPAAEQFLHDAGLAALLQPYRSRPRAMKHVTEIVGRAFRADPLSAQRRLRAAFLGDAPIAKRVTDWIDSKLAGAGTGKKVLLWIRQGAHHPRRNTQLAELVQLARLATGAGLVPILTGDPLPESGVTEDSFVAGAVDLILFWKDPLFRQLDRRRAQLQFFEHLRAAHGLVGQVGVTTAGMDGPALMGLPTTYLTDEPNVRMREWVGAVPGYHEVTRTTDYLDRVSDVMRAWAA